MGQPPMACKMKLRELLKHFVSLRLHGLTVRLVLGRVEGASYMVLFTHFNCWGLEVITTPLKPWIVFQVPCTDMFSTMWVFLNRGDRWETGNCLLLWIPNICFTIQNPPEALLKCQRGSGWATLPAMQDYAAENIRTQENINWAWNAEISIS